MSTLAHAAAPVNVSGYPDAALLPGSPARIHACGRPGLWEAIHAEYLRRGLDAAPAALDGPWYEPTAAELAELHGADHDAAPGDPNDLRWISQSSADYHAAEAELAEWAAERVAQVVEAEGYAWREMICCA